MENKLAFPLGVIIESRIEPKSARSLAVKLPLKDWILKLMARLLVK
jgi:hypothetical protein